LTPKDWDRVLHVDRFGACYLSGAILRHMPERGSGRIVNISSVVGSSANIGHGDYAVKAGVSGSR
jgi:NAD(P)-dependent dehydrogenase (short-subunit alcohol dehydrogenase family)